MWLPPSRSLVAAALKKLPLRLPDPGLLWLQLAHEQVQLRSTMSISLCQLLFTPPQLLILDAAPEQPATAPLRGSGSWEEMGGWGGMELPCPRGWSGGCWAWLVSCTGHPAVGQIEAQSNLLFTNQVGGQGRRLCWPKEKADFSFLPFFSLLFLIFEVFSIWKLSTKASVHPTHSPSIQLRQLLHKFFSRITFLLLSLSLLLSRVLKPISRPHAVSPVSTSG